MYGSSLSKNVYVSMILLDTRVLRTEKHRVGLSSGPRTRGAIPGGPQGLGIPPMTLSEASRVTEGGDRPPPGTNCHGPGVSSRYSNANAFKGHIYNWTGA